MSFTELHQSIIDLASYHSITLANHRLIDYGTTPPIFKSHVSMLGRGLIIDLIKRRFNKQLKAENSFFRGHLVSVLSLSAGMFAVYSNFYVDV